MKNLWLGRRTFVSFIGAAMLFAASESFAQLKLNDVNLTTLMKTKRKKADKKATFEQKAHKAIDTIIEEQSETCTLTVTLMNRKMQQEDYVVEWYILSEYNTGVFKDGKKAEPVRGVFEAGKRKMTLAAQAKGTETIEPKPLVLAKTTIDTLNENTGNQNIVIKEKGDTYLGYLVLVTMDGEIIAKEASSYPYQKDEWIKKCRRY